ncbi:MAG: 16S rRNA (uracil(1498)-N(3))-methyltransferase [Pseudomonadales bacterium]
MNIILLQEPDFTSATQVCIGGLRAKHINTVLRASNGDHLKVGLLGQQLGTGLVTSMTSNEITMDVTFTHDAPLPSPVSLILALPRPKMLKRVVRMVAELGIKELTLLNSYRVEKSYWQSPALWQENIDAYLHSGLAQAGDTVMPVVNIEKRFKPFVEDRLATLCAGRKAYVAHPGIGSAPIPKVDDGTLLAIGPEGGFIPYEIEKLQTEGLQLVNLGERILRVETAVPYALAALMHGNT